MNVILPDGSKFEIDEGSTVFDLASKISRGLAKKAVFADINEKPSDLSTVLKENDSVKIYTESDAEALEVLRHSTAHLMAQAVQRIFKDVKVTIGPVIQDGFYYDFDTETPFTTEDLEKIEKEMSNIAKEKLEITREEISKSEAIKLFTEMGETFKVEIIEELEEDTVSLYKQGEFTDLCRGPHVSNTSKIKHFKLLSVAGAYWRGDENNKMLQRIYGTAFFKKQELDDYFKMLEEAKRRDHRKLGKELELFSTFDEIGAGLICWLPKGARMRSTIEDFWKEEHFKNGYEILYTPHIGKSNLWETSGHLGFYNENMYSPMDIEGNDYYIKPMNCPFHIMTYKMKTRSYRDLPMRLAELGTVYRYEKSGVLHGLLRVRGFTQDDAHIICTQEQIEDEISEVLDFSLKMWEAFGFEKIKGYIATRPEKSVGDDAMWQKAIVSLTKAIEKSGLDFEVDEGGGAFYGPKIDLKVRDAIGREWQMTTIQFDFNLPERFDMIYVDNTGSEKRPYMVHRALLGSLEIFFGVLTEHYAGAFPIWFAPLQARIITISDEQLDYAKEIEKKLKAEGIRVDIDARSEKMGFKIREAQLQKIPHMIIIGKQEFADKKISIRLRNGENKNNLDFSEYISVLSRLNNSKSLSLWIGGES
jgi:threonyl-tRNA synthetase